MKILIMGAGAVGAYYGARLQQAGEEVIFCARGANLSALCENGLQVKNRAKGDFTLKVKATDRPTEYAPYDLVLFAVKSYDTENAARQLENCLTPDGIIMTIQNGVENEDLLCRFFGRTAVMGGNSIIGAELIAPGVVQHNAVGVIQFGELDGQETPRARKLAELFKRAGILGELTADLKTIRWYKLMGNNSTNSVSALTGCTIGEMVADPAGYALLHTLMLETVAAGVAEGARMHPERAEERLAALKSLDNVDQIKTSTLQDLERGKPLEYEGICGAVVRTAHRHGLSVPMTETMYSLLKLRDGSLRRGKK